MAQEQRRGCGFRKVGGIYLVADGMWADCDRLPVAVGHCPTCHGGVKYPRAPLEIDPLTLFGTHENCIEGVMDGSAQGVRYPRNCQMCFPQKEVAYLLGVGEQFYKTPQDFAEEAVRLGISKRISQIPKKLEVGKTWIYLVHRFGITVTNEDTGEKKPQMAVFAAFRPRRIEKILWESQAAALTEQEKKDYERRGITIVTFKDGDPDHVADKDLPNRLCDVPGCGKRARWFQSQSMSPNEPAMCRRHRKQQERALERQDAKYSTGG